MSDLCLVNMSAISTFPNVTCSLRITSEINPSKMWYVLEVSLRMTVNLQLWKNPELFLPLFVWEVYKGNIAITLRVTTTAQT